MDDGDEDLLSSSEDEGVEVDIDELEDDDEGTENTKLLHQLAASLAQEFKCSRKWSPSSPGRATRQERSGAYGAEMLQQNTSYLDRGCLQSPKADAKALASVRPSDLFVRDELDARNGRAKFTDLDGFRRESRGGGRPFEPKDPPYAGYASLDRRRLRTDEPMEAAQQPGKHFGQQEQDPGSWAAGWDACATEALRYLVEDEGLPLHHPTVVAMKSHLDLQRERAFAQYAGYTGAKSQDMNLVLD